MSRVDTSAKTLGEQNEGDNGRADNDANDERQKQEDLFLALREERGPPGTERNAVLVCRFLVRFWHEFSHQLINDGGLRSAAATGTGQQITQVQRTVPTLLFFEVARAGFQ